ncbi:MAG: Ig-like domain-containing protein [Rhodocyclales bacterium]|nr:Ig-like domain-containing protein [Rhodocyclales bacterium]
MNFGETLTKGTGNIVIYKGTDNSVVETIAVSGSQIAISGTGASTQVSINPTADLVKDQTYYVKIDSGALLDVSGNAYAGISDATTWNFTGAGVTVTINAVAGNNVVSLAESASAIAVGGSLVAEATVLDGFVANDFTSAVLKPVGGGTNISLTNLVYNPTTDLWTAQIDANALSGQKDYTLEVTFTGSTGLAQGVVGTGTATVRVDTVANAPEITAVVDNGGVTTDRITNDSTPVLTVTAETGGSLALYQQNGTAVSASAYSVTETAGTYTVTVNTQLAAGGYGLVATDAAGNVSAAPTAGTSATFTIDLTAPTTTVSNMAFSADTGTAGDFTTKTAAQTITATLSAALASDERLLGSLDNGTTWNDFSSFVTGTALSLTGQTLTASNTMKLKVQDAAGNDGAAASQAYVLDQSAPAAITLSLNSSGNLVYTGQETNATIQVSADGTTGWAAFNSATDIPNNAEYTRYFRQVDNADNPGPASSVYTFYQGTANADSQNFGTKTNSIFSMLGAGNDVLVAGSGSDRLSGEGGADTITGGGGADSIDLGAGDAAADVLKLLAATDSTVSAPDSIGNFGSGSVADKIDLSAILSANSYASSVLADTGSGFVEIKNLTLTKGTSTTTVNFDITFDAAIYPVTGQSSKISGAVLDLHYAYTSVSNAQATSVQYTGDFGATNVWSNMQYNLKTTGTTTANGRIAIAADQDTLTANPIIDSNGKTLSVSLIVNSLVDTFAVGLESGSGKTEITTAAGQTHVVEVGITKTAGAVAGSTSVLEVVADTTTLGTVGDNQLHFVSTYDGANTHLQVRYDTNSTFGTTTLSDIIALDFAGDVTASLVPANLTFI